MTIGGTIFDRYHNFFIRENSVKTNTIFWWHFKGGGVLDIQPKKLVVCMHNWQYMTESNKI